MENHIVLSLGPEGSNRRNSEGSFLRLEDGEILFIYSRFEGDYDDGAPSDLYMIRSADEGETWTKPEMTLSASRFGVSNIMSVSLLRMQNGDVGMFFIVKRPQDVDEIVLARSSDEGKTWYRFVRCDIPGREAYYVLNNDRAERLASGRIILPLAVHPSQPVAGVPYYFEGRGYFTALYSDDDGETFRLSDDNVYPSFVHTKSGLQEPGVVELRDGVLWGYARTDQQVQYEFYSYDGGVHWSAAQPSVFTSPCSPMKIRREPESGKLVSVWNPIPNYNGRPKYPAGWGRTPIVFSESGDNGETWSRPVVIEGKEEYGYCYPAVFFTNDGAFLTAYCAGGPEDGICLARLTISKIFM